MLYKRTLDHITRDDKIHRVPCFILLARRDMAVRTETTLCVIVATSTLDGSDSPRTKHSTTPYSSFVAHRQRISQLNVANDQAAPRSPLPIETTSFGLYTLLYLLVHLYYIWTLHLSAPVFRTPSSIYSIPSSFTTLFTLRSNPLNIRRIKSWTVMSSLSEKGGD